MKYAVQYAYDRGIYTSSFSMSNIVIVEDTKPISYEEAIELFNNHLKDFKKRLRNEERPNLVIWKDVGDGEYPVYGEELINLDWNDDLKIRGDKFYKVVEQEIELPE